MSPRLAFTLEEVAQALGVSARTLRRWRSDGRVRVVEIGGIKRIRAEELDRLLRAHEDPESRVDAMIDNLTSLLAG